MPIRPENRARYPADWKAISARIRFDRAGGQCECDGRCGRERCRPRCTAKHGEPHPVTGSKVILTTAHLSDPIEDCRDANLMAMCQACHLLYDMALHVANARETRKRKRAPILAMASRLAFEVACFGPAIAQDAARAPIAARG